MKIIRFLAIIYLIFLTTLTFAQNSGGYWDTDYLGRKTWVGDDGTQGTYDTDYLGRKTYQDNNGTQGTYDTDYLGRETYKDNKGNSGHYDTDYLGRKTWVPDNRYLLFINQKLN